MKQDLKEEIQIPNGITVQIAEGTLKVKGPKGENSRNCAIPGVHVEVGNGKITLSAKAATKRETAKLYATQAHVKNMIKGVQEPYTYTLKICSGHFPMNITLINNKFAVKNFFGEKIPRTIQVSPEANVKIEGDKITVTSTDIEMAGKTASNIELLTKISKRDRRIFQDGIYITQKPGETA